MRAAAAVAAATAALVLVPSALGHGSVQPTLARPGSTALFTFTVLNGRDVGMVGFRLELPPGAAVVEPVPQPGWRATSSERRVEWRGGPVPPGASGSFALRARMPAVERTVSFTGHEVFRDGSGPPFGLDVVLAGGAAQGEPDDEGGRTLLVVVIAGGVLLVAAALVARRRRAG